MPAWLDLNRAALCRNAFDRLTALSNALLVNGDYHVHGNSRELLQADLLLHASGIPSSRPPHVAAPEQPAASGSPAIQPLQEGAPDVHGWRAFAARLEAPSSAGAVQDGGALSEAADAGEPPAAPVDPEEDIFEWAAPLEAASAFRSGAASQEAVMVSDQIAAAVPERGQSGPTVEKRSDGTSPQAAARQHGVLPDESTSVPSEQAGAQSALEGMDAEASATADSAQHPSPSCTSADTNMVFAEPPSAEPDKSAPMEGFEYDADSGYYYNSLIGAYYDPYNRLFGDAASGHWFSLKNGEYQVVA